MPVTRFSYTFNSRGGNYQYPIFILTLTPLICRLLLWLSVDFIGNDLWFSEKKLVHYGCWILTMTTTMSSNNNNIKKMFFNIGALHFKIKHIAKRNQLEKHTKIYIFPSLSLTPINTILHSLRRRRASLSYNARV